MASASGYDDCYCFSLRRGSRHVTRRYDAQLAPVGLSVSQFTVLSIVDRHPGIRVNDLGRILVMDRTTLVRSLKPLLTAGLLATARQKGERAYTYSLTRHGRDKLLAAAPLWLAAQAEFERTFGAARAARLRADNLAVAAMRGDAGGGADPDDGSGTTATAFGQEP